MLIITELHVSGGDTCIPIITTILYKLALSFSLRVGSSGVQGASGSRVAGFGLSFLWLHARIGPRTFLKSIEYGLYKYGKVLWFFQLSYSIYSRMAVILHLPPALLWPQALGLSTICWGLSQESACPILLSIQVTTMRSLGQN